MADTVEGSGEGSGEGWAAAPGEALTTIPIKAKRGKLIVKSELAKKNLQEVSPKSRLQV